MNKKKLFYTALALSLTLFAVILFLIFGEIERSPRLYATFDSPKGNYRCTIYETPPPLFFYASPHIYTFSIQALPSGLDLTGQKYVCGTDSSSLGDATPSWAENSVTIYTPVSAPQRIKGTISGGIQSWAEPEKGSN